MGRKLGWWGGGHNSLIDFYRILFIGCIISHHSMYLENAGFVPLKGGYVCVEFFFILSGYLLANSANKKIAGDIINISKDTFNEIKKRILNMYFYFIPAFILSFIVVHWAQAVVDEGRRITLGVVISDLINSIWELLFFEMSGLGRMNGSTYLYVGPMWYFSAMLISILIVYPLLRYYKDMFSIIIAPLLVIFCYGYYSVSYESLGSIYNWKSFLLDGNLRAVAGMSIGCICFYAVTKRDEKESYNRLVWITLVEIVLIGCSLYYMNIYSVTNKDFLHVLIFYVLIYLAFAEKSLLNKLFNNKIFLFLGKFSSAIFVSHFIAIHLPSFLYPEMWKYRYAMYVGIVIVVSYIDYLIANISKSVLFKYEGKKI